jgi:lysophospholipase L1-like esterase
MLLAVSAVVFVHQLLTPVATAAGPDGLVAGWSTFSPTPGSTTQGAQAQVRGPDSTPSAAERDPGSRGSRMRASPGAATTAPATWTVVGLGDSVPAGTDCGCTPFVEQYASITAQRLGRPVQVRNFGTPSLTSPGLLDQLQDGTPTASGVAGADIVLVTIGANDAAEALDQWAQGICGQACFDADVATIQGQVTQVVSRILALRDGRPTEVLVTTYWNVVQDGTVAKQTYPEHYMEVSDALTREVDTALCNASRAAGDARQPQGGGDGVICVDLYAPFKGNGDVDPTPLLATDGDHPDAAGHQLIANTLAGVGWAALEG